MLRQDPAYDIFIDLDAEGMSNLLGDALIAELGIMTLHFDDRGDEFLRGPFGPGLARTPVEENKRRYFRSTSAL